MTTDDPASAADLAALDETIGDSADQRGPGLAGELASLAAYARTAVPSLTGVELTVPTPAGPFVVAWPAQLPPSAASARIPIRAGGGAVLTLHAGTAGALVDAAADLAYALGLGLDDIELDGGRLPARDGAGLAGIGTVNRAIGILLGQGLTPEYALESLRRPASLPDGDHPIIEAARDRLRPS